MSHHLQQIFVRRLLQSLNPFVMELVASNSADTACQDVFRVQVPLAVGKFWPFRIFECWETLSMYLKMITPCKRYKICFLHSSSLTKLQSKLITMITPDGAIDFSLQESQQD